MRAKFLTADDAYPEMRRHKHGGGGGGGGGGGAQPFKGPANRPINGTVDLNKSAFTTTKRGDKEILTAKTNSLKKYGFGGQRNLHVIDSNGRRAKYEMFSYNGNTFSYKELFGDSRIEITGL